MIRLTYKVYLLWRRATVDREFVPGKLYQHANITYYGKDRS